MRPVAGSKRRSPTPSVPPEEPRRNYAAKGIAALIAPVVRPAFRRRAPAAAQLLADWDEIAGVELAARAAPVKFAGGTLTLACTGPTAMELQLLSPQIIERLNMSLGHEMVERLRFVQETPVLTPRPAAPRVAAPVPPPVNLPEGELGDVLGRLYQGIMSRK